MTANGTLRADRVIVAANGFMPEHLLKEVQGVPLPMISAIVVTRPLTDDELAAHSWRTEDPAINSRELMNYFRLLPDKRFMFGGRGHSSGAEGSDESVRRNLLAALHRQWPEWRDVEAEYFWHGLICMTRRLTPCVGRIQREPTIFYGFGYHGNGVNTSVWTGKQLARWLAGSGKRDTAIPDGIPVMMQGMSPRFPAPTMRLHYLRLGLLWKRLQDQTS